MFDYCPLDYAHYMNYRKGMHRSEKGAAQGDLRGAVYKVLYDAGRTTRNEIKEKLSMLSSVVGIQVVSRDEHTGWPDDERCTCGFTIDRHGVVIACPHRDKSLHLYTYTPVAAPPSLRIRALSAMQELLARTELTRDGLDAAIAQLLRELLQKLPTGKEET